MEKLHCHHITEKLLVYPWKDTLPQTLLGHLLSFQDVGSLEALAQHLDLHGLKPARNRGLEDLKPKITDNAARNFSTGALWSRRSVRINYHEEDIL